MVFPKYKEILELVKKGATVEAQEKIMELREFAIELQEENLQLKEDIAKLKSEAKLKEVLTFKDGVYYQESDDELIGPFCPKCHDSDKKQIRLHEFEGMYTGKLWNCRNCKSDYERKNV